jgi:hypothetical protein
MRKKIVIKMALTQPKKAECNFHREWQKVDKKEKKEVVEYKK